MLPSTVARATAHIRELSRGITGEFFFSAPPATPAAKQDNLRVRDLAAQAWTATQHTTSIAVLRAYISRFGDTFYGLLAQARIDELKKQRIASLPQNSSPPVETTQLKIQSDAQYAILIDASTGDVLYERNADRPFQPGSFSKLMVAEIVFSKLKSGAVKSNDKFVVSKKAWIQGGPPSRTASMFTKLNDRISVDVLLRGLIVQSANDASIALAEGVAGDESAFARLMTKRARELGLSHAFFSNVTGLPDDRSSVTARELAKLARHIIKNYSRYYAYFRMREFTWNNIRQINRNILLRMNIGADGLKTSFVKQFGYGLVGSAVRDRRRLIVVVHGLKTANDRTSAATTLLEAGFRQISRHNLPPVSGNFTIERHGANPEACSRRPC